LYAAGERLDAAALLGYFDADGVVTVNGAYMRHDEFAESVQDAWRGLQDLTITVREMRVDVLGSDVVAVTDFTTGTAIDTAGIVLLDEMTFAHTEVWVRRNGHWKTLHGHESYP
jgi:hypothetical protein